VAGTDPPGYDAAELIPAPSPYFDADGPAASGPSAAPATQALLTVSYLQRATFYENELVAGYQRIRFGGTPRGPEHPQSRARLRGGQEVTVTYDSTLDGQLGQVYAYYGWAGITAVEASLLAAARDSVTGRLHPWPVVRSFFTFTRNRLAVLVQDALVDLSAACADHVAAQLNDAATIVAKDWARLRLEQTETGPDGMKEPLLPPSLDTPVRTYRKFWRIGDRDLAKRLFEPVRRVVAAREDLRQLEAKGDRLREAMAMDDGPPPDSVVMDVAETEQAAGRMQADMDILYQDVADVLPLGTLVVPLLSLPLKQAQMEHLLGVALGELNGRAEAVVRDINEGGDYLRARYGTWDAAKPLETYLPDGGSVEEALVKLALDDGADKPRYLPVLSEEALDAIVASGRVPRDSFTYVVWAHYKSAVVRGLAAERAREEMIARAVGEVARVAAMLSLLSPWTGTGLRVVSVFLGVGMLAFQAYSVVHQLSRLERQVSGALIELEATNARQVAAFRELMSLPGNYLAEATQAILVEVGLIIAAGAVDEIKQLWHYRAYYLDLQMLLET